MHSSLAILTALLPLVPAETVLGIYLFHRHGDRTSKSFAPTSLTDLGYSQVYASGNFYRDRYVSSNASSPIYGISTDLAKLSQLAVEAPVDNVLQSSAMGFLQGLYPPVGATLGSQTLASGTSVEAPLNGYQLIPVNTVTSASSAANSENSAWLQGQSGCNNAIVSSNNYFYSAAYNATLESTNSFYQSILPTINNTFTSATDTYKNAYSSTFTSPSHPKCNVNRIQSGILSTSPKFTTQPSNHPPSLPQPTSSNFKRSLTSTNSHSPTMPRSQSVLSLDPHSQHRFCNNSTQPSSVNQSSRSVSNSVLTLHSSHSSVLQTFQQYLRTSLVSWITRAPWHSSSSLMRRCPTRHTQLYRISQFDSCLRTALHRRIH